MAKILPSQYPEILALKNAGERPVVLAKQYGVNPGLIYAITKAASVGLNDSHMYSVWQKQKFEGESALDFVERYSKERGWSSYSKFRKLKNHSSTIQRIKLNFSTLLMRVAIKNNLSKVKSLSELLNITDTFMGDLLNQNSLPRGKGNLDAILSEINSQLGTEYQYFDDLIFLDSDEEYTKIRTQYAELGNQNLPQSTQTVGSYLNQKMNEQNLDIKAIAAQIPGCKPISIKNLFGEDFNGTSRYLDSIAIILGIPMTKLIGIRNRANKG